MATSRKATHRKIAQPEKKPKVWWQSMTVIGGLVSILAPAVGLVTHITLDVDTTNAITVNLVGIATGIGGLLSIWGRIRTGQERTVVPITLTRQS